MSVALDTRANERGTYVVDVSFLDEDENAVTPNEASWTLSDANGSVVNNRLEVAITPAETVSIVLSGLDLAVGGSLEGTDRFLLVEFTYDSDIGSDVPATQEFKFQINDFAYRGGLS